MSALTLYSNGGRVYLSQPLTDRYTEWIRTYLRQSNNASTINCIHYNSRIVILSYFNLLYYKVFKHYGRRNLLRKKIYSRWSLLPPYLCAFTKYLDKQSLITYSCCSFNIFNSTRLSIILHYSTVVDAKI